MRRDRRIAIYAAGAAAAREQDLAEHAFAARHLADVENDVEITAQCRKLRDVVVEAAAVRVAHRGYRRNIVVQHRRDRLPLTGRAHGGERLAFEAGETGGVLAGVHQACIERIRERVLARAGIAEHEEFAVAAYKTPDHILRLSIDTAH